MILPQNASKAKPGTMAGFWHLAGGAEGNRTPDLLIANEALSHLSYGPMPLRALPGGAGQAESF